MTPRSRRSVTISDVAKRAEVSLGTVSRVMNNHPGVDAELRLRVLSAARELGYLHRARSSGQVPVPANDPAMNGNGKTRRVAFCWRGLPNEQQSSPLIMDMEIEYRRRQWELSPYVSLVLHGAEAECRKQDLQLSSYIFDDTPEELPRIKAVLQDLHIDAVLMVCFTNHELVNGLVELDRPIVVIDHYFPDLALDVVTNDSYYGTYRAMQHLIDCGHTRIGFVHCPGLYPIQRRFEAYQLALSRALIPFRSEYVLMGTLALEGGKQVGEDFLQRQLDCTAIVCANDLTAIGFMQTLIQHGIRVPQDISVIGFDDIDAARLVSPPLTTVRAYATQVGQMGIIKVLERMADPLLPITQTLVHADLVSRESVLDLRTTSA